MIRLIKLTLSADKEEENSKRKRVRLDLFLKIPRTSETPSVKNEYQKDYIAISPTEEAQVIY